MPSVITRTIRSMTQDGIGRAPRGFAVWGSRTGLDAGSLHHAQEFLDRRAALDDLAQAVFLEIDHPVLAGLGLDLVGRRVLAQELLHGVGDHQQLEDPRAADVAGTA